LALEKSLVAEVVPTSDAVMHLLAPRGFPHLSQPAEQSDGQAEDQAQDQPAA
jgi:hypothetical protein